MGAKPFTFLDYIASERLNPAVIEEIVSGMVAGCIDTGVSLVGGETAEMPGTYLKGEHDLVGVITGVVEKEKIITGAKITSGDIVLGLPSSGLHTNGYSLARKVFFEIGGYNIDDKVPGLDKSVGHTLLEPTLTIRIIFFLIDSNIPLNGIAHITGGGLLENIPRILPKGLDVEIETTSWPALPVFSSFNQLAR